MQAGITKTALPDHQLIFCTSKIKRQKPNKHSDLTFGSLEHFSTDCSNEALSKVTFAHYENFSWQNKMTPIIKKSGLMSRLLKTSCPRHTI